MTSKLEVEHTKGRTLLFRWYRYSYIVSIFVALRFRMRACTITVVHYSALAVALYIFATPARVLLLKG
jgi:hypothetical protein